MLFHSKHGSIFAKHVIKRGLPEKKLPVGDKKRVYPSGFSGKRAAKTGKLYALKAERHGCYSRIPYDERKPSFC